MTEDAKPAPPPRKGKQLFVVNVGRDMLEFEVDADDFEVVAEGVHFIRNQGKANEYVCAFASHPCLVAFKDDAA